MSTFRIARPLVSRDARFSVDAAPLLGTLVSSPPIHGLALVLTFSRDARSSVDAAPLLETLVSSPPIHLLALLLTFSRDARFVLQRSAVRILSRRAAFTIIFVCGMWEAIELEGLQQVTVT